LGIFLITSKVLDVSAKERRLSRMNNTSQGGATEGNATDDALMVDQGDVPAEERRRQEIRVTKRGRIEHMPASRAPTYLFIDATTRKH
jgi:hypothetical protein